MTPGKVSSETKLFLGISEGAQAWYGSLPGPDLILVITQDQVKVLMTGFCGKVLEPLCLTSLHFSFLTISKPLAEESNVLAGMGEAGTEPAAVTRGHGYTTQVW